MMMIKEEFRFFYIFVLVSVFTQVFFLYFVLWYFKYKLNSNEVLLRYQGVFKSYNVLNSRYTNNYVTVNSNEKLRKRITFGS